MHPFRDDRRSKSIEEREEEYQRVRERIFAHDVSSCFNCLLSMVLPLAKRPLVSQTGSWQGVRGWDQGESHKAENTNVSGKEPGSGMWWKQESACAPGIEMGFGSVKETVNSEIPLHP